MLRDEIKSYVEKTKCPVMPVPTPDYPQWDGKIFVTRTNQRAIASCWKEAAEDDGVDERAAFVQLVACDSEGSRIFQPEDVLMLSTTPHLTPLVERLYFAGRHFCGLTDENREAWRKNSASTGDAGSPSSCAEQSTPDTAST
jgi:hypothetical protein